MLASRRTHMRILVADQDPHLTTAARSRRWTGAHQVQVVGDGREAMQRLRTWQPDVLVIAADLPGINAMDVARHIAERPGAKVLVLADHNREGAVLGAFDLGVDAIIEKPVSPGVLFAMVDSIARRAETEPSNRPSARLRVGPLMMDPTWHEATWGDASLQLTRQQFRILYLMARQAGRAVTYGELIDYAWEPMHTETGTAVPFSVQVSRLLNHVARIRARIRAAAGPGVNPIVTLPRHGYRLVA